MAKIELGIFGRRLKQQITNETIITTEIHAIETERNAVHSIIDWQFRTPDARIKLMKLYPSISLCLTSRCGGVFGAKRQKHHHIYYPPREILKTLKDFKDYSGVLYSVYIYACIIFLSQLAKTSPEDFSGKEHGACISFESRPGR